MSSIISLNNERILKQGGGIRTIILVKRDR